MSWFQALILGLVQGLTEYLPVSSSGHLTIGQYLFGIDGEGAMDFEIMVHVATVLSTCVILRKEIVWLFKDLFKYEWNRGTRYVVSILVSMIPVAIVGLFFNDDIKEFFNYDSVGELCGNPILLVGICMLITACLLIFTYFDKTESKDDISPLHAFIIGIAQAIAVLPGISRSGSTIATGLHLGDSKEKLAQFSFLMVIPPILGQALLDAKDMFFPDAEVVVQAASTPTIALVVGFLAAFVSGCFACKWMINLVKKGKLIWFGFYCAIIGILAIVLPYCL